jgi:hypothetical protein
MLPVVPAALGRAFDSWTKLGKPGEGARNHGSMEHVSSLHKPKSHL